jgi:hypothetical protein
MINWFKNFIMEACPIQPYLIELPYNVKDGDFKILQLIEECQKGCDNDTISVHLSKAFV